MRRPLHWILLSLPLSVLSLPGEPGPVLTGSQPTPFAYVRADGTELYVQYAGSAVPHPEMTEEDVRVTTDAEGGPDLRAAIYTWSTPISAPTSASTSSL